MNSGSPTGYPIGAHYQLYSSVEQDRRAFGNNDLASDILQLRDYIEGEVDILHEHLTDLQNRQTEQSSDLENCKLSILQSLDDVELGLSQLHMHTDSMSRVSLALKATMDCIYSLMVKVCVFVGFRVEAQR